jgi:protein SCO1/2
LDEPSVVFLSFSIDPANDDAAARIEFGRRHNVDLARWHFVAPPDRAAALLLGHAMKVASKPGKPDYAMLHVDRFVLVDPQGRTRGSYLEADPHAMRRLVEDARTLLTETRPAVGARAN